MPVKSSVRVRACGPMLAPPLLDSGLQPAAGSPPRQQQLGGAGREGAGGRVRPARARVPCGREARAPPTFLPLSRVGAGAPGCVGGGSGAGAGHRHARCAPSTPGPAWAGRAPRGSALSCLWREEASPDIPQRAAVGRWGLSGSRLAWPTPSGARGARPVPEEPPGEVSGQGTAERRCNGPRPGLAPRLRAGRGRLRWPGAPTLGWGRRGGRVRWALRGRQRLPPHVPACPFSCVWPPRCCHAVALERSSGLAQKPLWDAEKWRPKVTLLQAAGEGRGRRGRQRGCPQRSDPASWSPATVPGRAGV